MKKKKHYSNIFFLTMPILLASLFCIAKSASAANYYVDATGGNDSYTSTQAQNQATPWKTISKINGSAFQPGDLILFKRGQVWREPLVVSSSGADGRPITFGAYGTGNNPVIQGSTKVSAGDNTWTSLGNNLYQITKPYWIASTYGKAWRGDINDNSPSSSGRMRMINPAVKDLDFYFLNNYGQVVYSSSNPTNYDWEFATKLYGVDTNKDSPKSYLVIENIDFKLQSDFGVWIRPGSEHVTVRNCNFYGDGIGSIFAQGRYTTISGCGSFYSGSTGFYLAHVATEEDGATDSIIENSTVKYSGIYESKGDRGGIGVQENRCIVRNNYLESNGPDINQPEQTADASIGVYNSKNVLVENNTVIDSGRWGIYTHGDNENIVRYNLVKNWRRAGDQFCSGSTTGGIVVMPYWETPQPNHWSAQIYNNTLISTKSGGKVVGILFTNPDTAEFPGAVYYGLQVKNNSIHINNGFSGNLALWSGRDKFMDTTETTPTKTIIDNNNYYVAGNTTPIYFIGVFYSLSNWKNSNYPSNVSNADEHSSDLDPIFVSASDFRLQSSSPLIDRGANVGLTSDIVGTAVPQGIAPDIGAYEYKPSIPAYSAADLNSDNLVNATDFNILKTDFLKLTANLTNPKSDIDSDGQCTVRDAGIMMSGWKP